MVVKVINKKISIQYSCGEFFVENFEDDFFLVLKYA